MKWDNPESENLLNAILRLKNLSEAKRFFRDLLTEEEIVEFAKRWQAAQMLAKKVPYSKIQAQTGLSSTTVARVAKWLNQGMGGYKLMLQKLVSHWEARRGGARRATHHHASWPVGKGLN